MFKQAEQMKKSCEGMRNYRSEMIQKEKNLEKKFENKSEYQRLNEEAKKSFLEQERKILIIEQDSDWKLRFDALKSEIQENREHRLLKRFKQFTNVEAMKTFAEQENISPDLAYKLVGDYSHRETTLSLLNAEGEFAKLLLHRQFVDGSIQDSKMNREATEKLGFMKDEKEEKDFRIIDSIIKQLEKPRNQFSGLHYFDDLA